MQLAPLVLALIILREGEALIEADLIISKLQPMTRPRVLIIDIWIKMWLAQIPCFPQRKTEGQRDMYDDSSYVRWQLNGTNKKIVCFVKVWKPLGQDIGSFEDRHNFEDLWNFGKFLTKGFALVWHQFLIDFSLKWTKKRSSASQA